MCKFIIACLISLSALSFSSCTQKKVATSVAYMDFPQTIELKARVQPLDTALFRYPFRVRVQGDKAVVMDLHGTDYFCHVFHYPGFRYFASFGKRGEAPEEMLSAENTSSTAISTMPPIFRYLLLFTSRMLVNFFLAA